MSTKHTHTHITNVHNSFIIISQQLETTQMFIKMGVDKQTTVHPYNWVPLGYYKEWTVNACYNMDGYQNNSSDWKASETEYMLYDSYYIHFYKMQSHL